MSEDLPNMKPDDSVELCMSLMTQQNIRYLPVFENDRLCGIISMSDVVKETILATKRNHQSPGKLYQELIPVSIHLN